MLWKLIERKLFEVERSENRGIKITENWTWRGLFITYNIYI